MAFKGRRRIDFVVFKGKMRINSTPFKGRRRINSPCVRKVLELILFFFFQIGSWSSGLVLFITCFLLLVLQFILLVFQFVLLLLQYLHPSRKFLIFFSI